MVFLLEMYFVVLLKNKVVYKMCLNLVEFAALPPFLEPK